jgi:outer membrane protein OmpA-like peptidoglycan-associated protein
MKLAGIHYLDLAILVGVAALAQHMQAVRPLRRVRPEAEKQMRYWQERVASLCTDRGPLPTIPVPPAGPAPEAWFGFINQLDEAGSAIWQRAGECAEPRSIVIPESVLHFKVDRFDEFEGDSERGFRAIFDFVDQHRPTRQLVAVTGHCDETYTDEHNYLLSFRRALYVAGRIKTHLDGQGLRGGADYALLPVGMGRSQLLPREPGEAETEWWGRCRRIEITMRPGGSQ